MATVSWGRRQPVDEAAYVPPDPTPILPGPVGTQPYTPPLTGTKVPQTRNNPTAPTIQPASGGAAYAFQQPMQDYATTLQNGTLNQNDYAHTTTLAHPNFPTQPPSSSGVLGPGPGHYYWPSDGTYHTTPPPTPGTTPAAGTGGQATTAPGSYASPAASADTAKLVADYIASQGLQANQSDPTALHAIVNYLRTKGVNAQVDYTDANGHTGGILIDGHPYQLINGSNQWTALQPWEQSGGGGSNDPNADLYFNELLSRMQQLRQGVNDPMAPLYQLMALQRISSLQGAPFTGAEDAALTARYMNPLTQARDQQLQMNKEQIGAHGMLPTSGLLQELNKGTNANYQHGVALGANDLGVRAVQEKQRRQDEQLQILTDLLSQGRNARTENNQQADALINLASQFPAFDERRLAALTNASQDNSAAQGSQALVNQQSAQLQAALQRAKNQAERDAAWGAFFGSIINNWDKIFT